MVPSTMARPTSAATMMGRRGNRSTHAPPGRPSRRNGSVPVAERTPISAGDARSTRTAIMGSARRVNWLPNTDTVSAAHNLRKSAWVQSEVPVIENSGVRHPREFLAQRDRERRHRLFFEGEPRPGGLKQFGERSAASQGQRGPVAGDGFADVRARRVQPDLERPQLGDAVLDVIERIQKDKQLRMPM